MSFLQKMGVSVRSWKEFGNTSKLQLPSVSNPNLLLQRLQTNVMHWSGNYLIISAIIFGYGLYVATSSTLSFIRPNRQAQFPISPLPFHLCISL
jgi:hypothetical protein